MKAQPTMKAAVRLTRLNKYPDNLCRPIAKLLCHVIVYGLPANTKPDTKLLNRRRTENHAVTRLPDSL